MLQIEPFQLNNIMNTDTDHIHPSPNIFRPDSYWEDNDPLAAILRNVKGTNRRQMIRDYWNAGHIEDLDPALLADETDPGFRNFLECLHPSFMGGEYLLDLLPTEVEIARIELQSTTSDVISIRARHEPGSAHIHYRIIDEYDTTFEIDPETSAEPLTHDELVRLIDTVDQGDGGGLAIVYNQSNLDSGSDADSLRNFTNVRSDFYPDLFDHYDHIHEQWVAESMKHDEDAEDGPDES
jgi:hypothetical protein